VTRKRWIYLIGAIVVTAGVLAVIFRPEREPEYGGKKLSEWVEQLQESTGRSEMKAGKQAAEAIQLIGTNGLPYLLSWIRYEQAAWKKNLHATVNRMIRHAPPSWYLRDKRLILRGGAFSAIGVLGTNASTAIPDLAVMMNDPNGDRRSVALITLTCLGKAAVPTLVSALADSHNRVRPVICMQIARMGADARPAVPELVRLLDDPDRNLRSAARSALQQISPYALEDYK